jgi:adenosylhomocysteinase
MGFSASESSGTAVEDGGYVNLSDGRYEIIDGRMTTGDLFGSVLSVLRGEGIPVEDLLGADKVSRGEYRIVLDGTPVRIRSRAIADPAPGTLDAVDPPAARTQVLIAAAGALSEKAEAVFDRLVQAVNLRGQCYTDAEIDSIVRGVPLVNRYATDEPAFRDWALIFRDHYVENSVGFLLGMERAGMDPKWIFALSKGDRTLHRDRVHASFRHRGYRSDILDNSVINGSADTAERAYALAVNEQVDQFIRQAHASGRKVLVIDDGGLLAQGYGAVGVLDEHIDGALELTVSGLKRIVNAPGELAVPVLNMARSRLKTMLGYHEIADSCVRRLRAILPGEKFLGRHVLLLGFGTLGTRVAHYLRSQGVRVSVVDTDMLALITAAEHGYETYTSTAEALRAHTPFLVIGSTGELVLTHDELPLLPDGVYLAGFATKDFSLLSEGFEGLRSTEIPSVGVRYTLPTGTTATLLGDGRSLNLFEYEGIANRGYDAYRAGTLIAARMLCREAGRLGPGLHLEPVDQAIDEAGLFAAYYEQYLASGCCRPAFPAQDGMARETR